MKKTAKLLVCIILIATFLMSMIPMAFAAGNYLPRYKGSSGSIVPPLNTVGVQSSYSYRAKIAAANNISNYTGTAAQNIKMLNMLKQGTLKSPETPSSSSKASTNSSVANQYLPRYKGSSGSIVTALNAVGVQSSYAYRAKIAAANNISNYTGTAAQNIKMLNMLKQGTLKSPEATASKTAPTVSKLSHINSHSANVYPQGAKLMEVKKNNAPLRTSYSEKAKAIYKCKTGTVLQVVNQTYNSYNNLWYQVKYNSKTYWIYSGNVKAHKCDFEYLSCGDINYSFCNCGKVTGQATSCSTVYGVQYTFDGGYKLQKTNSLQAVIPPVSQIPVKEIIQSGIAAALSIADGPLPFGELLAAALIAATGATIYYGSVPSKEEVTDVTKEWTNVKPETMEKARKAGKAYSVVLRPMNFNLKCIGKKIDVFTALFALRNGRDIYTDNYGLAAVLGEIYVSKDRQTLCYYNEPAHTYTEGKSAYPHIHLGVKSGYKCSKDSRGHAFYGTNGFGKRPDGWTKSISVI